MELREININEALGISSSRINKKQVKEYLDNLNIYDSESPNHMQTKGLKELAEKDLKDIFETSWKKSLGTKELKRDESQEAEKGKNQRISSKFPLFPTMQNTTVNI